MSLLSSLSNRLTGLEQVRTLLTADRQPSIHEALDIALIAADEGTVVGTHTGRPSHTGYMTLELQILYHRAITPAIGRLRAEGKLLSVGRRAVFSEAKLFDVNHRLLASASSTLLVMPVRAEDSPRMIKAAVQTWHDGT